MCESLQTVSVCKIEYTIDTGDYEKIKELTGYVIEYGNINHIL